jgi:triacylglycerol lipase
VLLGEFRSTSDRSRWPAPPPGHERPAMLVPGFLAGDQRLARNGGLAARRRLADDAVRDRRQRGLHGARSRRSERRLEEVVQTTGQRALVVGQSRGGTFGRVLAARRPDAAGIASPPRGARQLGRLSTC